MEEKVFNEYRRKFKVMCASKWANIDRDELESVFNESLAMSLNAYDESRSDVTFDTFMRCNLIRAVNVMKRDNGRQKRTAEFVDAYELMPYSGVAELAEDREPSVEAQAVSKESVRDIYREVDDYIEYKMQSPRCDNNRDEFRRLFDMWFDGYDIYEISEQCNMKGSKVYTIRKEFKQRCRKYLK